MVGEVRREQGVESIIAQAPLLCLEANHLEYRILAGVGEDGLLDPIARPLARVDEPIERNARRRVLDPMLGVVALRREETVPFGNHQSEVADARVVDAGVIDLGEDAPPEREPDEALGRRVRGQRRADPVLGAEAPGREGARVSGGLPHLAPGLTIAPGGRPRPGQRDRPRGLLPPRGGSRLPPPLHRRAPRGFRLRRTSGRRHRPPPLPRHLVLLRVFDRVRRSDRDDRVLTGGSGPGPTRDRVAC